MIAASLCHSLVLQLLITGVLLSNAGSLLVEDCSFQLIGVAESSAVLKVICSDPYTLYVAFGQEEDSLDEQTLERQLKSDKKSPPQYQTRFQLDGLAAGTTYFYRLVMQGAAPCDVDCDVSPLNSFETEPASLASEPSSGTDDPCIMLSPEPPERVLSRPTHDSIMIVILSRFDISVLVVHVSDSEEMLPGSPLLEGEDSYTILANSPQRISIDGLQAGSKYYYRMDFIYPGCSSLVRSGIMGFFSTAPTTNQEPFQFVVTADTHWDFSPEWEEKSSDFKLTLQSIYQEAEQGTARFMVELGDTFMGSKRSLDEETINLPYQDLFKLYSNNLFGSMPLFLCTGNHEGENGWALKGVDSRPVWTAQTRMEYFANPEPGDFYTGNRQIQEFPGSDFSLGFQEDYYSWEWGNALFAVLTPFWYSVEKHSPTPGWDWTLGKQQHEWLQNTLETSGATFRFIFVHNLLGGAFGEATERDYNGLGGAEWARFFEWGGLDEDGEYKFNQFRTDWGVPVHEMLIQADARTGGRSIVFKGHDHLYAKTSLGGESVVYQTVPQPWGGNGKGKDRALEQGVGLYNLDDVLEENAGYLIVTPGGTCTTVVFKSPAGTSIQEGQYSVCAASAN